MFQTANLQRDNYLTTRGKMAQIRFENCARSHVHPEHETTPARLQPSGVRPSTLEVPDVAHITPRRTNHQRRRTLYPNTRAHDNNVETVIGQRVKVNKLSGCWLWTGSLSNGYGKHHLIDTPVHRFIYERLVGDIEPGHILHHICEVKRCVNPEHLQSMTPSDHKRLHNQLAAERRP